MIYLNLTKQRFTILFFMSIITSLNCMANPLGPYETVTEIEAKAFKIVGLPLASSTKFWISQGAFGTNSHNELGNEYHWDFDVPYGTDVVAVEDGIVLLVWEPEDNGGGCDQKYSTQVHNIKIEHKDGTIAQYSHIKSFVKKGQLVKKGEKIAVTAKNGFICQPQLCFAIFQSKYNLWGSDKCKTIPLRFESVPRGILKQGYNGIVP